MLKKLSISLGVLLALGVVGLAWFSRESNTPVTILTPLPQIEHVWSKYENPVRGFTLEYPSDVLTPREGGVHEPSLVVFERSDPSAFEGIQITWQKTDYHDATSYYAQSPNAERLIPTTIGGVSALKQLDTVYSFTMLFFVHGGKIYTMRMNLSPADTEHVQQSFYFTN